MALMAAFDWDDPEDIAMALMEAHPDVNPLSIRFTDLHKWVAFYCRVPWATRRNRTKLNSKPSKWHGMKNFPTGNRQMTTQLRRTLPNWITFPQKLRDAIPAFEPCAGRVLELSTASTPRATDSDWFGRRVAVKLRVCETGKLDGAFDVWLDLNPAAAQALAEALHAAADRAVKAI